MRQLSLQRIGDATGRTTQRFPLPLLSALVAAIAGVMLADDGDSPLLRDLVLAAQLGIPLLLAAALAGERAPTWRLPRGAGSVLAVLAATLVVAYGLSLPRILGQADWLRYAHLNVGAHLLVVVAPFLRPTQREGLWAFGIALALRFLAAVFFSLVLFAGLSVALLALDQLLGVGIPGERYLQLFMLIAFLFNTAYFLGGVPADLDVPLARADQPRLVRIFAQSILAPLVAVYLVILLVYLVKVVATATWPSGWIGYLVSSVALAGLLSLVLLAPRLDRPDAPWVRRYARLFHLLMLPAVAMLALAVQQRLNQYGVTEARYVLLVLTAWLAVVVVVGLVRPRPRVWAIPASLCVLAFATALGPWSSFALSRHAQLGRLSDMLAAAGRLDDGRFVSADEALSADQSGPISRQLDYLFEHFGHRALAGRIDATLQHELDQVVADTDSPRVSSRELAQATSRSLNVAYLDAWRGVSDTHRSFHGGRGQDGTEVVPVAGFQYLVPRVFIAATPVALDLDGRTLTIAPDWTLDQLALTLDDGDSLILPLSGLKDALMEHDRLTGQTLAPDSLLSVEGRAPGLRARLLVRNIDWNDDTADTTIEPTVGGALLIGW